MDDLIQNLISDLQAYQGENVFNPWRDYDAKLDISPDAPAIRTDNLKKYFQERQKARFIFVAEGLGYQGGRFSGLAMTSERQLCEDFFDQIFKGSKTRTSHPNATEKKTVQARGFSENTGTIVWRTLEGLLDTRDWLTWNLFPWHPHRPQQLLTNRAPKADEQSAGFGILDKHQAFLLKDRHVIAVGRISSQQLSQAGIAHTAVRHPANGGGSLFKLQVEKYLKSFILD